MGRSGHCAANDVLENSEGGLSVENGRREVSEMSLYSRAKCWTNNEFQIPEIEARASESTPEHYGGLLGDPNARRMVVCDFYFPRTMLFVDDMATRSAEKFKTRNESYRSQKSQFAHQSHRRGTPGVFLDGLGGLRIFPCDFDLRSKMLPAG